MSEELFMYLLELSNNIFPGGDVILTVFVRISNISRRYEIFVDMIEVNAEF